MKLTSKLPHVGTTIFTVMSALAEKHRAINLSQGFPDFDCDDQLKEWVNHFMIKGKNQYAPMPGVLALRKQIAKKIERTQGARINPETEITITAGATQALFTVISCFIHPGDEVIIFEPAYDSYTPSIKLNGGKCIPYALLAPEFKINWEEVRTLISERTRMIIVNSPHNPTGACLNKNDLDQLAQIAIENDILILSDEVYEHIIFDGRNHESVLSDPRLKKNCIAVYSFGKTFHSTGWKIGYIISNEVLMKEIRKVHQYNVFSVNTPMQYALSEYLKEEKHIDQLSSFYQGKRDLFRQWVTKSRFKALKCEGSYFQIVDYSSISKTDDLSFVNELTKRFKVAAIPISVFRSHPVNEYLIRFCFAKRKNTLDQAGERLVGV